LIRAELDALKFIRERKDETVELIAQLLRMEREVAQKSYDFTASFFSKDARINPDGVKKLIAIEQETGGLKADVSVGQVAALSLVDEVQRELAGR
jgi:hypothetical protein